jgi:hypothetical protein
MSFDDMMIWLITAMGLTALVFLFATLAALVRTNRSALAMGGERGRQLHGLASHDPGGPA